MLIIPSLYIQKGKAVSLYKGHDNDQKKVYSKSPLNMAKEFAANGAALIQIIDLDGSQNHGPENLSIIRDIIEAVNVPIEVAGGIRSMEHIQECFDAGVHSVVLGVSARDLIPEALAKYGSGRILFGIKARRSMVESDSLPPESDEVIEIAEQVVELGITQVIYSDMEAQGVLFHPNYDDVDRLLMILPNHIKIYSSGGIKGMNDLDILYKIKTAGAIVSRALIEHKISISKAIDFYETDQDRAFLRDLPETR
jgi:phosphoribosylformimino-5-aminoimidazole carboxamide ribotide isomerase